MKECTKCLLKETHDTIMFDENGVCSVCRQVDNKHAIDWEANRKEFDELLDQFRNKGLYDCIIPFSGGKDSVFQLWYAVRQLKLKPLVVRFNHWGYRPIMQKNNTKVFKQLGVDVFEFTPNWHVTRELMLESLKRRGDFCWHCHTGIYAGVINIAVQFEIPLVMWGESLAEYASWYSFEEKEEVDEKRFNRAMNQGITADDMFEFLEGRVSKRDLWMFRYPSRAKVRQLGLRSICLGNYVKWETKKQVEIIKKELDWEGIEVESVPPEYDYEKIECKYQGVRDYCKFIKRGYGRTNHLACIDIRHGHLSREEGDGLQKEYDGKRPASLDYFLKILEITEEEFNKIISKHTVHPWEFRPEEVEDGKPLKDMPEWDKTEVDQLVGHAGKHGKKSSDTYI